MLAATKVKMGHSKKIIALQGGGSVKFEKAFLHLIKPYLPSLSNDRFHINLLTGKDY